MSVYFLLIAIAIPVAAGLVLYFTGTESFRAIKLITMPAVLVTSVLVWLCILLTDSTELGLIAITDTMRLALRFDGLGKFFAAIVAALWPLTTLYAFEYMTAENRLRPFFSFFLMSYGVTLGVAMSASLLTLYCFYELLTLVTIPLVIHTLTKQAVRAARTYMVCSIGGAAFAFAAVIFLIVSGAGGDFAYGGLLKVHPYASRSITYIMYILGFMGFGVKAAVFPMDFWLPKATVAPTPVTALLHAVAVVKSGAFAIMRLTFYAFGTELLAGTWAQTVVMAVAIFTIFYGSSRAVKEVHFKRKMAYSTVANLSYILFGVTLMTPAGLSAGLMHMAFHAVTKILAFFCVGAVMHETGREYLPQLNGLGAKMPVTFACFTVSALSLTGIPLFDGFISKWYLLISAADLGTTASYIGAGVLLLSALLTAIYMFAAPVRAFFPHDGGSRAELEGVKEVNWKMTVPMIILAALVIITGIFPGPIVDAAGKIAAGLI